MPSACSETPLRRRQDGCQHVVTAHCRACAALDNCVILDSLVEVLAVSLEIGAEVLRTYGGTGDWVRDGIKTVSVAVVVPRHAKFVG